MCVHCASVCAQCVCVCVVPVCFYILYFLFNVQGLTIFIMQMYRWRNRDKCIPLSKNQGFFIWTFLFSYVYSLICFCVFGSRGCLRGTDGSGQHKAGKQSVKGRDQLLYIWLMCNMLHISEKCIMNCSLHRAIHANTRVTWSELFQISFMDTKLFEKGVWGCVYFEVSM